MSRMNGQVKVDRGRMAWESIRKPCVKHAIEVWWSVGHSAGRKLESAQLRVGRKMLGESNTLAEEAAEGYLGWRM